MSSNGAENTTDSRTPTLTAERVSQIMKDCLFKDEELTPDGEVPSEAVIVAGIMNRFGFHPARLAANRDEIRELLEELPEEFHARGGGGMSFLNACLDKSGRQWGEHPSMDQLFSLGKAVGMVSCPLPREAWSVLPGGVPYYTVDTSKAGF